MSPVAEVATKSEEPSVHVFIEDVAGIRLEADIPCKTIIGQVMVDFFESQGWSGEEAQTRGQQAIVELVNPLDSEETKRLDSKRTICQTEVKDGDTLRILPEISNVNVINIFIETPSGERFQAEIPCGTTVGKVAVDFFESQDWPLPDRSEGRQRAVVELVNRNNPDDTRRLNATKDICESGVSNGDTVRIFPESIGGGPPRLSRTDTWLHDGVKRRHILRGHRSPIAQVAWSPNGRMLASASARDEILLWNTDNGQLLHILTPDFPSGFPIIAIAWSPDGRLLASASSRGQILLWNTDNGQPLHILHKSHRDTITSIAWSPNGDILAWASRDGVIKFWNKAEEFLNPLVTSHRNPITSIAWSPNGDILASASMDKTIQLWHPDTGECLHTFTGHLGIVINIAWSPNGNNLASSSTDNTIRLWSIPSKEQQRILEGFSEAIDCLAFSFDGRFLASKSLDGTVRLWRSDAWEELQIVREEVPGGDNISRGDYRLPGFAFHPQALVIAVPGEGNMAIQILDLDPNLLFTSGVTSSVNYANAKVVLLGDTSVGKTGLSLVLTGKPFSPTESSHGRSVWPFDTREVALDEVRTETHEIFLWDLAGQPGYRLIHQLHLNEVAVALVVFDAHSETDPFAGVQYWDRALRQAQRLQGKSALPLKKLLVASRTDRGGISVSAERIQEFVKELDFASYFETSAKEGWQIRELREAVCQQIDWEALPRVSSTGLFQQIKRFLIEEKKRSRHLLSSVEDLYSTFLKSKDAPQETVELPTQFETCIGRVESAGFIKQLSFANLILLQPELLDAYASALVNFVRNEPDGLGSIAEDQVRAGDFHMPTDERIQDAEQEKLLLIAMIEDLLRRELVLREDGTLIFPSQSTKEHPDLPDPPGKSVVFGFEGPVVNIYATLAVRLARSGLFKKQNLWRNAVTYTTSRNGTCGLYLRNLGEGYGELTLFFDQAVGGEMRQIFEEYIHLHLVRSALPDGFSVRHIVVCSRCDTTISDETIQRRKARGFDWLNCSVCDARISLVAHEQPLTVEPSTHTQKMDQAADIQREHEAARSILQGKIETGDFDVFLCHHGSDKSTVKQIGEQLKEHGILPWLDEWELRPGLPWQRLLEQQIEKIKTAAVFVGKSGLGPWQQQELEAFLREFVHRNCPVIPVLLSDAPEKPALPIFLQGFTWVDLRLEEPDPMQQLLWGITGKRKMNEKM